MASQNTQRNEKFPHKEVIDDFGSILKEDTKSFIDEIIDQIIDLAIAERDKEIAEMVGRMGTTCCQENEEFGDCNCKYNDDPFVRKANVIDLITNSKK